MTGISNHSISFQNLRALAHQNAKSTFEKEYPLAQQSSEGLGAFQTRLSIRNSELQHAQVTTPSKEDLLEERKLKLAAYWAFRETAQKVKELSRGFSAIVMFLTPQLRQYADEESLRIDAPELQEEFNACDEVSRQYLSEVLNWHGKMDTLQRKMFEQGVVAQFSPREWLPDGRLI